MLKISCLHSSRSDVAAFEAARRELRLDDVILKHRVRADLRAQIEGEPGHPSLAMLRQLASELVSLARGADALLLNGPALERIAAPAASRLRLPVVLANEALAAEATADGGTVIVLCTCSAVIAWARPLFESAAMATGANVEIRLVPDVNAADGPEGDAVLPIIAEAADSAAEEAGTVALAQSSMAAAARLAKCRPLVLPGSSLKAAVAAARAASTAGP